MTSFAPNNAIGFAQFLLRGGWKNLLWMTGLYTVAVGGLMIATASMGSATGMGTYSTWASGLLGLQIVILLFFGTNRVTGAIRADLASGMIESHRLMPTPPAQAILGYVFGSSSHAIGIGVANFVLGAAATAGAKLPLSLWVASNLVVFWFIACVWVVAAMLAFAPRGAMLLLSLPLISIWFSQGASVEVMPGLAVLISPMAGHSVFSWAAWAATQSYAMVIGAVAQGFFAAICFIGACRKYRQADAQALSAPLALLMVAGWSAISALAMWQWDLFEPRYLRFVKVDRPAQIVATIISIVVFALLPIAAAVRADAGWRRRRAIGDPALPRRPLPVLATVAVGMLMVLAITGVEVLHPSGPNYGGSMLRDQPARLLWLAGLAVVSLLCPTYLLRILYRGGGKGAGIVVVWLVLIWLGPLLAEFALNMNNNAAWDFPGPVASISPAVAAYTVLRSDPWNAIAGIVLQAIVAMILAGLFHGGERRMARVHTSKARLQRV